MKSTLRTTAARETSVTADAPNKASISYILNPELCSDRTPITSSTPSLPISSKEADFRGCLVRSKPVKAPVSISMTIAQPKSSAPSSSVTPSRLRPRSVSKPGGVKRPIFNMPPMLAITKPSRARPLASGHKVAQYAPTTDETLRTCRICSRMFARKDYVKKHFIAVHVKAELNAREYHKISSQKRQDPERRKGQTVPALKFDHQPVSQGHRQALQQTHQPNIDIMPALHEKKGSMAPVQNFQHQGQRYAEYPPQQLIKRIVHQESNQGPFYFHNQTPPTQAAQHQAYLNANYQQNQLLPIQPQVQQPYFAPNEESQHSSRQLQVYGPSSPLPLYATRPQSQHPTQDGVQKQWQHHPHSSSNLMHVNQVMEQQQHPRTTYQHNQNPIQGQSTTLDQNQKNPQQLPHNTRHQQ
jgi:hypothetical protein